ncbi:hypothetical protein C8J57DRAFT_1218505 [Mycena rebaudengoi]|nr:hypothetical protein C8J57DRAFT_1218505 [Mycena rebaudengoi]
MAGTIHCDNTRNRTSSELELILKIGGIEPGTGGFLKSNFGEGAGGRGSNSLPISIPEASAASQNAGGSSSTVATHTQPSPHSDHRIDRKFFVKQQRSWDGSPQSDDESRKKLRPLSTSEWVAPPENPLRQSDRGRKQSKPQLRKEGKTMTGMKGWAVVSDGSESNEEYFFWYSIIYWNLMITCRASESLRYDGSSKNRSNAATV